MGPYVFIYGGLRGSALLEDFLLADDSNDPGGSELSICDPRSNAWWAPLAVFTHAYHHRGACLCTAPGIFC